MPDPEPLDIFKHVYSSPNSWLDRQQDHYSRYLASFGDPGGASTGASTGASAGATTQEGAR
jgi:pyruvate dehydrogenase E1 component alpha subunit